MIRRGRARPSPRILAGTALGRAGRARERHRTRRPVGCSRSACQRRRSSSGSSLATCRDPGCRRLTRARARPRDRADLLAPPRDGVRERLLERDLGLPAGRRVQPLVGAAHLHHLVRAAQLRVDLVRDPHARHPAERLHQLGRRRRPPGADVVDARFRARRERPVRAHDVAHVGVVAPRGGVAGADSHRILARLQPRRELARERRDRVDRLLPRPGVVERPRADDPQPVRVGVEARPAGRRSPSTPRTGSAAAAAPTRRPAASPAARTAPTSRRPRSPPPAPRRARASSRCSVIAALSRRYASGSRHDSPTCARAARW